MSIKNIVIENLTYITETCIETQTGQQLGIAAAFIENVWSMLTFSQRSMRYNRKLRVWHAKYSGKQEDP